MRYAHPDLDGEFGSGRGFVLDGVQYQPVFWQTHSVAKIAALGFVEVPERAPTLEERKAAMLAEVSARRWAVETGGIVVNGAPIRTDEIGQAKLTGAVALFDNDPDLESIDWEGQPGMWVTLDGETIRALGVAVGRHVQACFTRARALHEAIAAAETHGDLDAIDLEAGWPE